MNLAQTQHAAKKVVVVAVTLTLLYYTGKFIILGGQWAYRQINPPPPALPEARFGTLPQLKMTTVPIAGEPEYVLDTVNGSLPNLKDRIKVYPMIEPTPTL